MPSRDKIPRNFFEDCSILLALKILGKKWMIFVLSELIVNKEVYFTDLQTSVRDKYSKSISGRVLTDRLSMLEDNQIIIRTINPHVIPVRVSYSLTVKGKDLIIALGVLKGWGAKWGGIDQKKCLSFTCLHNAVSMVDIDKALLIGPWIKKSGQ
ncbi:MAG: HTH-type transcriptional activator HxlR [Candidatus Heimdallarchaeota archaeon LC_3]|nr:MAG: HTH-type transcriptional activator HxlR [Candidatus Heimdallarchaeota archaeon LC_3]